MVERPRRMISGSKPVSTRLAATFTVPSPPRESGRQTASATASMSRPAAPGMSLRPVPPAAARRLPTWSPPPARSSTSLAGGRGRASGGGPNYRGKLPPQRPGRRDGAHRGASANPPTRRTVVHAGDRGTVDRGGQRAKGTAAPASPARRRSRTRQPWRRATGATSSPGGAPHGPHRSRPGLSRPVMPLTRMLVAHHVPAMPRSGAGTTVAETASPAKPPARACVVGGRPARKHLVEYGESCGDPGGLPVEREASPLRHGSHRRGIELASLRDPRSPAACATSADAVAAPGRHMISGD
jgi:hypothetical protein